ncbi:MAG: flagellar biosynthetic protein FliR [Nitrospiraceae bacterium]|nr:flagellar biosynthetic protein FliR [Nitrospiraceae bacterium]
MNSFSGIMHAANMNIFASYLPVFLLVLLRTSTAVAFMPFFSSTLFPLRIRVAFAVTLALVLTPVVSFPIPARPEIAGVIIREVFLGMAIGFCFRLVFFAVEMAGQIMSMAMGLSMATILNPEMGQATELTTLYSMIAMLFFLIVDGHHELIFAFVRSFEWAPPGKVSISHLAPAVLAMSGKMFVISLKLAAPVLIAGLTINLLLGFLQKAAPQMNIFFVSYPLYMLVGFVLLILGLPVFMNVIGSYLDGARSDVFRIISLAKG